ncbi:MAG: DUF6503 family protein, partial [Cyclobacteriaceae bacterium]
MKTYNISATPLSIFVMTRKSMMHNLSVIFTLVLSLNAIAQDAKSILEKSIQYHDPKGEWNSFNHQMVFVSERPGGSDRKSTVMINNNKGFFSLEEEGSTMSVIMDSCSVVPDGKTCENVKRTRNYYIYLWGLPMKLKDQGTTIDSKVEQVQFEGTDCYVIRVPYDQDVWFFYIAKSNYAM